jgi:RHS repeat-associated protein
MCTYKAVGNDSDLKALDLKQTEKYLYGSSRLGLITSDDGVNDGPDPMQNYYQRASLDYDRGFKQYELTNHLGNVLATVSDRKFAVPSDTSSLIDHYEPHIVTAQDYYPFGMMSRVALPNSGRTYKFGFNGKMNDDEVKGGLGNQQDYGMRIYDSRVGRFLSVDPLTKKFPQYTPYSFSGNSPIWLIDKNGTEPDRNQAGTIGEAIEQWTTKLKNPTVADIYKYMKENSDAVRYVYTKDRGWIDLKHYFGTFTHGKIPMDLLEPASGNKFLQDKVFGLDANDSYYSYEDLSTNKFASEISEKIGVKISIAITEFKEGKELLSLVKKQFESSGATNPENAPNWNQIPYKDHGERRRVPEIKGYEKSVHYGVVGGNLIPRTVNQPIYYTEEEKKELLKSGKYIPQNHTSEPYDLNNFPAAPSSIEKGDRRKGITGH